MNIMIIPFDIKIGLSFYMRTLVSESERNKTKSAPEQLLIMHSTVAIASQQRIRYIPPASIKV